MSKINILAMSLDPFLKDNSEKKSKEIRNVISSYKFDYDKKAEVDKINIHSFCPRDNTGYTQYFDTRLEEIEEPTIIILSNLLDMSNNGNQAYGRLYYALTLENVKAIYITSYSTDYDVSKYMDTLEKIFRVSNSHTRKPRRIEVSDTLIRAMINLRKEEPPVLYKDLAEVTNLQETFLNKILAGYVTGRGKGAPIKPHQVKYLKEAMKASREIVYDRYDIVEETYLYKK